RHSLAVRQRRRLLVDREPRGDGRAARDPRARPRVALLAAPLVVLPVSAGAIRKLLREVAAPGPDDHVLAVGGADELAPELRQQFLRGHAEPGAVRLGDAEGAAVYGHVPAVAPGDQAIRRLRPPRRARVPAV